ncbi:hypothetical protein Hanom_Chr00s000005g01612271 [Helianthus anomalus]
MHLLVLGFKWMVKLFSVHRFPFNPYLCLLCSKALLSVQFSLFCTKLHLYTLRLLLGSLYAFKVTMVQEFSEIGSWFVLKFVYLHFVLV